MICCGSLILPGSTSRKVSSCKDKMAAAVKKGPGSASLTSHGASKVL